MSILLDIGGEGRHPGAWNVNLRRHRTLAPERGAAIPRLIVARAERLPLADRSVKRVIVERTPLRAATIDEIRRVVAPGGTIVLRHVALPSRDRHALAKRMLRGRARSRRRQLGGGQVRETVIRVPGQRGMVGK